MRGLGKGLTPFSYLFERGFIVKTDKKNRDPEELVHVVQCSIRTWAPGNAPSRVHKNPQRACARGLQ